MIDRGFSPLCDNCCITYKSQGFSTERVRLRIYQSNLISASPRPHPEKRMYETAILDSQAFSPDNCPESSAVLHVLYTWLNILTPKNPRFHKYLLARTEASEVWCNHHEGTSYNAHSASKTVPDRTNTKFDGEVAGRASNGVGRDKTQKCPIGFIRARGRGR